MTYIKNVILCFYTILKELLLLRKKQSLSAEILQTSHRLEKGLTIKNPRPLWGWDKAHRLLRLVNESSDDFAKETGASVINAFAEHKIHNGNKEEVESANKLLQQLGESVKINRGGAVKLSKDMLCSYHTECFEQLLNLRHSVRDFANTPVDLNLILRAIEMANHCPSACNRQPYHVYIVDCKKWQNIHNDGNQVYGADKHLLITASIQDYSFDEANDWIVSASIFAGYLTLSLTSLGLGSCVIRKRLADDSSIRNLKRKLNIPKSEKIIIEIAVGNYKEKFKVAYSNRKMPTDIATYVS